MGTIEPFYIVTVNYKSGQFLQNLIKSVEHVSGLRQLIIIDHSGELSRSAFTVNIPLRIIKAENRGYGAGLNRGLREIPESEALVLLCNPDVRLLTPERLKQVAEYMKLNRKVGALSPRIITSKGLHISSCRQFYSLLTVTMVRIGWIVKRCPGFIKSHYYWDKGFENSFVADWASGAALFCRLSAFSDRNFFDERFFLYFEDVDFSARLWKNGWTIEYFPKFVVEHHEARRSHKYLTYFTVHVRSLIKFIWKYKGFPTRESLQKQSVFTKILNRALEPD